MSRVLEGIKVVELAQVFAGPGIGMYLADQGAQVIKVEPPQGDLSRHLGDGGKPYYLLNRNKRGIVVDITKDQGKVITYRLVEGADILIHSFRPGVAERLGYGYEALAQGNPRLIYAHITGYGPQGPYAHRPGYDRLIQGLCGVMAAAAGPEGEPRPLPLWIADSSLPMLMAYGIMLALWHREKTGRGQRVESSQLQAALAMQLVQLVATAQHPTFSGERATGTHLYRTQDGSYLNICVLNEREWSALCRALGLEALEKEPRFASVTQRNERYHELYPILAEALLQKSAATWLQELPEQGVPCGPVLPRSSLWEEPQVRENTLLIEREHPEVGWVRMIDVPLRLSETPGIVEGPAPRLGEHTREVLAELGYAEPEINALAERGVIRCL